MKKFIFIIVTILSLSGCTSLAFNENYSSEQSPDTTNNQVNLSSQDSDVDLSEQSSTADSTDQDTTNNQVNLSSQDSNVDLCEQSSTADSANPGINTITDNTYPSDVTTQNTNNNESISITTADEAIEYLSKSEFNSSVGFIYDVLPTETNAAYFDIQVRAKDLVSNGGSGTVGIYRVLTDGQYYLNN